MKHFYLYGAKLGYWDRQVRGLESRVEFKVHPLPKDKPWKVVPIFQTLEADALFFWKKVEPRMAGSIRVNGYSIQPSMPEAVLPYFFRLDPKNPPHVIFCGQREALFYTRWVGRAQEFGCSNCPNELICKLDATGVTPFGPTSLDEEH